MTTPLLYVLSLPFLVFSNLSPIFLVNDYYGDLLEFSILFLCKFDPFPAPFALYFPMYCRNSAIPEMRMMQGTA